MCLWGIGDAGRARSPQGARCSVDRGGRLLLSSLFERSKARDGARSVDGCEVKCGPDVARECRFHEGEVSLFERQSTSHTVRVRLFSLFRS